MTTFKRTLNNSLLNASQTFPVVLVTGPRQVGKTTLLENCAESGRNYVSLDDYEQRQLAQNDPALFLQYHKTPLIIDEVQYAPELFNAIKIMVDKKKCNGLFWLTGSQKFQLMQGITESLAGRVAILELQGFARAEIENRATTLTPFLPNEIWLKKAKKRQPKTQDVNQVFEDIWRGSYPRVINEQQISTDLFYNSYLQTYIQRDVRDLTRVTDEKAFRDFIRAVAARTSQLLNYANLAREVGIDQKTAKAWLSVLETSGLIYCLQPYHNNLTKRLIKTPKVYFLDTGLCRYLTQWSSSRTLSSGAFSGAIFETYVISECLKSYWYNGLTPYFYFYRDKDMKEVDLLIEQDNQLHPIEIKKTASPSTASIKNFTVLKKLGKEISSGAVICLKETDVPLSSEVHAIPIGYL
ncbi:MAG: ATP-binding protein [Methylococcales bacterium]|nr:ATP-binding protein [Methylococcales bacterium]MBT7409956.1 ATP-binding protein [Methylococcales bacterium]